MQIKSQLDSLQFRKAFESRSEQVYYTCLGSLQLCRLNQELARRIQTAEVLLRQFRKERLKTERMVLFKNSSLLINLVQRLLMTYTGHFVSMLDFRLNREKLGDIASPSKHEKERF